MKKSHKTEILKLKELQSVTFALKPKLTNTLDIQSDIQNNSTDALGSKITEQTIQHYHGSNMKIP